jgi:eukaryotic-like serine/threonine-protein kinase
MTSQERIGPYRVQRLLGVGSFATVWLGYDSALAGHVAIKVLAENWSHDLRVRERFRDEGRMLWRLDDSRLVRVHGLGELADGRPYLVMEWAAGGSLRDRLAADPVPVGEALPLIREIALGVAVLHREGIVHRDLTPGNVLFRPRPESPAQPAGPGPVEPADVLISDLGLAKSLAAASGLTVRAGTPGYMAPEQDDPFSAVDTRADVYGLGRLGLALLGDPATGRSAEPTLRAGVPPGLLDVLRTATARRPGDRYHDATAFLAAFDDAVAAGRTDRARPAWRYTGAVLAMLAVLAAAGGDRAAGSPPAADAADPTGRIAVTVPPGWRLAGSGWAGQVGPDGRLAPAMLISPDPGRWTADPAVPGAFVGLSRTLAARTTPAGYVGEHPHAECADAAPVRTADLGGVRWTIARFAGCRTGKPVIVEAAATTPDGASLLYVQLAPPARSAGDFVDTLLAGVRARS